MANELSIPFTIAKTADEAFEEAKKQITPEYVAKFNVKADVDIDNTKKEIVAKGKGFKLSLSFSGTETSVGVELSFLLRPFKKQVLDAIERKLKKHV
jgi:hypothetical protein